MEHDSAIITENMYQAVLNGHLAKVPLLIGMCSEEGLTAAKSKYVSKDIYSAVNYKRSRLINTRNI